jgi:hypothetical protein
MLVLGLLSLSESDSRSLTLLVLAATNPGHSVPPVVSDSDGFQSDSAETFRPCSQ